MPRLLGDPFTPREWVYVQCFEQRCVLDGRWKLHHDGRLVDLEADPEEWNNLSGKAALGELEEKLKGRILAQFDPDQIEHDVSQSLLKRQLIREAMKINDTHWDYFPDFDATQQYVRGKPPVQY